VVLVGTLVLLLATGGPRSLAALPGAPWHHYLAGVAGFTVIDPSPSCSPGWGRPPALALMVLGQGVMALVIDHHGLWGIAPGTGDRPAPAGGGLPGRRMLLLRR
jgi:uncharacterized membrane protein YdcZ (DUF606 family)